MTGVYIRHYPLHAGSVALELNTINGYFYPQYNVVFDEKFFNVYHMRKVTVTENWKNMVDEHSELATQKNFNPEKKKAS